ncbi:uncharacterized protein LOC114323653 [Camellia sinensis]|uniref:uncharacterized protein LOC114323653 n=1 Tax=Camellia sinensis TaxID=4442 RepID=UPI00103649D5|nr:uncharacterized protein LOC114323653 [Camellia sinensis]
MHYASFFHLKDLQVFTGRVIFQLAEDIPCISAVVVALLSEFYDYERLKTLNLVKKNKSRVAITTDMWTVNNEKKRFVAVTAHFIDDSWALQSCILRCALSAGDTCTGPGFSGFPEKSPHPQHISRIL